MAELILGTPPNCLSFKFKSIFITINSCYIMELNDFIVNFADQFEDTDPSDIKAETVFHDLDEYSSLIALSIIAMVDEEYDVQLKGDDMRAAVTVEDLYNVVKSKIA